MMNMMMMMMMIIIITIMMMMIITTIMIIMITIPTTTTIIMVRAGIFRFQYVAFSEARHQWFSPGTQASSRPSSINCSANKLKLK